MSGIGIRLKEARQKAGISQGELAKRVRLSQQGIQAIEAGRARKSLKVLELAAALGVSPEWLEGRSNVREPDKDFRHDNLPARTATDDEDIKRLPVHDI